MSFLVILERQNLCTEIKIALTIPTPEVNFGTTLMYRSYSPMCTSRFHDLDNFLRFFFILKKNEILTSFAKKFQ